MKVLIVGAGIGGLCTAIALSQIGSQVDVIEVKEDRSVPGVGFGLRLNGLRAAREIGILDRCLEVGKVATDIIYFDPSGNFLCDLSYGSPDGIIPSCLNLSRTGFINVATERALELGVNISMATTVKNLEQFENYVSVEFSHGGTSQYDLVIGCDGINSQIRREYFGSEFGPTPVGGVAWRTALPLANGMTQPIFCQGYGGKILFSPISDDTMYMVLTVAEQGRQRYETAEMPKLMYDRARTLLGESNFMADSIELIKQSKSVAYSPYSTVWVPYPWFRGRVMIIGDAAHAMTPYLGSGAAMAMEDGVVLAQELAKDQSFVDSQLAFMRRRLPRVRAVHDRSIESMHEEFDSVTPEAFQRRLVQLAKQEPIANEYANRLLAQDY